MQAVEYGEGWLGAENMHIPTFSEEHSTTAIVFEEVSQRVLELSKKVGEHKLPIAAAIFTAGALGSAAFAALRKTT